MRTLVILTACLTLVTWGLDAQDDPGRRRGGFGGGRGNFGARMIGPALAQIADQNGDGEVTAEEWKAFTGTVKKGEDSSKVTEYPSGLATQELGRLGVLFLRHQARSLGDGVVENRKSELGRGPKNDLARPTRQMGHQQCTGEDRLRHSIRFARWQIIWKAEATISRRRPSGWPRL